MSSLLFMRLVAGAAQAEPSRCEKVIDLISSPKYHVGSKPYPIWGSPKHRNTLYYLRSLMYYFSGCDGDDNEYSSTAYSLDRLMNQMHTRGVLDAVFEECESDPESDRMKQILDWYDFEMNARSLTEVLSREFPTEREKLKRSLQRIARITNGDTFIYEIGYMKRRLTIWGTDTHLPIVAALVRFAAPYIRTIFSEAMLLSPGYGKDHRTWPLKDVKLVNEILGMLKSFYYATEGEIKATLLNIAGSLTFEAGYFDDERLCQLESQVEKLKGRKLTLTILVTSIEYFIKIHREKLADDQPSASAAEESGTAQVLSRVYRGTQSRGMGAIHRLDAIDEWMPTYQVKPSP